MAYVSLYRKYRPQSFAEVVGQKHVTQTLANAIAEDRLHHAYLFTGPRGTGKTSTARILAKAINCEGGATATPCQTCPTCVAITAGTSVDVIELDMASHGGVDDARELRERALFAPVRARRKVYILDEVHMASTAAFNALLKLIEEPPAHVLFAMATTDPQKVIPTIMSRVQRLDLRRVPAEEVADHIRRLAALEGFTIDDAAVNAVVRAGEGSVRDSLSVLDQVRSYTGGDVTGNEVSEVLGHTPAERVSQAVALVAARELAGLLGLVQSLLDGGHDLRRFTYDLVGHLRDLLVLQAAPDRPDLVDATDERRAQLSGEASLLTREELVRAVELLAETLADQRRGPARLPLELALARLVVGPAAAATAPAAPSRAAETAPAAAPPRPAPRAGPDQRSAATPAAQQPTAGAAAPERPAEPATEAPTDAPTHAPTARRATTPSDEVTPAGAPATTGGDVDLAAIVSAWPTVLDAVRAASVRLHAIARAGSPTALDGRTLSLGFLRDFHATEVGKADNLALVRRALHDVLGAELDVRTVVTGDVQRTAEEPPPVSEQEEAEVREAEIDPEPAVDEDGAVALLQRELGAEPVDRS